MAASHDHDEGGGLFSGINVTPLVDITLVLLIIFMVAAPLMVSAPSIKVDLPKAATGDETQASTLALTLQRDPVEGSKLYANGKKTDESAMRTLVRGLVEKNRQLQAIIAADRGVPYGEVMHIVDVVRALGVSKFALNTEAVP
jgi:biopolymer transport protein ExbD